MPFFRLSRYKLTPYSIIGVPFAFYKYEMHVQALAHEIGHYIYSQSNDVTQPLTASAQLKLHLKTMLDYFIRVEGESPDNEVSIAGIEHIAGLPIVAEDNNRKDLIITILFSWVRR